MQVTERLKRDHDLAVAKARLFDDLVAKLEAITTDYDGHPDVLSSVEVALKVAKLEAHVAERAMRLRYPGVLS